MTALEEFCRTLRQLSDVVKQLSLIEDEKATIAAENSMVRWIR